MPTKNINIPKHLKQKMEEHPEVNWSNLMRDAAFDHLNTIEKKPVKDLEAEPAEEQPMPDQIKGVFTSMSSKTKKYLLLGAVGLIIWIAVWQYVLILGLIGGLGYLVWKRRQGK